MKFAEELISGKLIRRYKRFLADVELADGSVVVAHCTNSGSMKSCLEDNAQVYLTPVNDPKRKTKFTWEMIEIDNQWVGINTGNPNVVAYESIRDHLIPELSGYDKVKREVKFGDSRFDVMAENSKEICFVEVKNVTYKLGHRALFPDAVTTRGLKHLNTLVEVKKSGKRAVMLYIIQRQDVEAFGPAEDIDPEYAKALRYAMKHGVEVLAYQVMVTPHEITLGKRLPLEM